MQAVKHVSSKSASYVSMCQGMTPTLLSLQSPKGFKGTAYPEVLPLPQADRECFRLGPTAFGFLPPPIAVCGPCGSQVSVYAARLWVCVCVCARLFC